MKGFLQYGESIVLYSQNSLNPEMRSKIGRSEINESPFCGFLSTKGYMDTNVYFQTVDSPIEDATQEIESCSNFRDFVFQVTPKLKHEFNNAYQEVLKEFKKLKVTFKNLNAEARETKFHIVE
jgi:phage-related protein